ncbi:MAG: response regulator [Planctomycetes bacterium]|nr:response regulator [Planctomycetota bacterium]
MAAAREKTILVVDDMGTVRSAMALHLRNAGYKVVEADGGPAAFQIAAHEPLDLVILDVMMPKMDGFAVLEKLKKDARTEPVPVIMCTAKGLREDVIRGNQLGAVDYIVKPFSKAIVLEKVKRQIGDPPAKAAASKPSSVRIPPVKPSPPSPTSEGGPSAPAPPPAAPSPGAGSGPPPP